MESVDRHDKKHNLRQVLPCVVGCHIGLGAGQFPAQGGDPGPALPTVLHLEDGRLRIVHGPVHCRFASFAACEAIHSERNGQNPGMEPLVDDHVRSLDPLGWMGQSKTMGKSVFVERRWSRQNVHDPHLHAGKESHRGGAASRTIGKFETSLISGVSHRPAGVS